MALIADGLLIATALTATIYCVVLSRRLRRLSEAGGGIGERIEALSKALTETKAAMEETRSGVAEMRASAKHASERLSREVWIAMETTESMTAATSAARIAIADLEDAQKAAAAPPPARPPAFEAFPPDDEDEFDDDDSAVPVREVLDAASKDEPFPTEGGEAKAKPKIEAAEAEPLSTDPAPTEPAPAAPQPPAPLALTRASMAGRPLAVARMAN